MTELVYSTSKIKFHGNPFQICERLSEEGKIITKSKKVIIRNGKSKIIESITFSNKNSNGRSNKSIEALKKLNSLFRNTESIKGSNFIV